MNIAIILNRFLNFSISDFNESLHVNRFNIVNMLTDYIRSYCNYLGKIVEIRFLCLVLLLLLLLLFVCLVCLFVCLFVCFKHFWGAKYTNIISVRLVVGWLRCCFGHFGLEGLCVSLGLVFLRHVENGIHVYIQIYGIK